MKAETKTETKVAETKTAEPSETPKAAEPSETPRPSGQRITSVRLSVPVQFFGISGSQIAPSQGLVIEECARGIVVTSPSFPGKSVVIYPGGVSHVCYEDADA